MATDPIVRTYDPKQIVLTLGVIIASGYEEGTFIKITRSGDNFTKKKGSDGSIDRTNNNAFDFRVELTLKQSSPTNDLLSALQVSDALLNDGVKPLTIKDLRGTTLFFAQSAWIAKDPDDEFSNESGPRVWVIDTGIADKFTGSNI
jgi:hypothetical protein